MPVTRLGHVNIRTPLMAETVAFYEAALGLRAGRAQTVHDQVNFIWLYDERGAAVIHVNAPMGDEPIRPMGALGRIDHFAFDCADPEGFAERLTGAGVPFTVVHSDAGGFVQYNMYDPNGIRVELTFPPEG